MLEKATKEDLNTLKSKWSKDALIYGDNGAIYANDIMLKIDFLTQQIEKEKDSFVYIFKDNDKPKAILYIIHALPNSESSWLKLLDLDVAPEVVFGELSTKETAYLISDSIFESMQLLFNEHKEAKELKIYSRTEEMANFFSLIAKDKTFQKDLKDGDISCHISNQWLIFRKMN